MITAGEIFQAWDEAPLSDVAAITAGGPTLVLAPHPDDESLGFGGLIATAAARGETIEVAVLTDGAGSHPNSRQYPPARLKQLRAAETIAALAELDVTPNHVTFLEAPDAAAPHHGPAFAVFLARIETLVHARAIRTILTTWRHDPHCDHEAAALLAMAATRATGARLWFAPVWGWTLPAATALPEPAGEALRLDITARLPAKRRAIASHVSQTTALITDSPDPFRLEDKFLALFDRPWEVFIRP